MLGRPPKKSACRSSSSRSIGNQGRGVATNLATKEQVLAAYAAAREEESTILVEQFAPGGDYRLLVVGDKMVAAARREPAQVIGDGNPLGRRTRPDYERRPAPRRRSCHRRSAKSYLDAVALQVLADQGLTPASSPAGRHSRSDSPQCEPEHRRHGDRCHRAGASRRGGTGDRGGPRHRP